MRGLDLTGQRFGLLVVQSLFASGTTSGTRKRTWWVRCDCGELRIVPVSNLRSGNTRSCGCMRDRLTGLRSAARARCVERDEHRRAEGDDAMAEERAERDRDWRESAQ